MSIKSTPVQGLPPFYSLAPLYSVQTVLETREKQSKMWTHIILKYCQQNRIFVFNVANEEQKLFWNRTINRKLDRQGIVFFLEDMIARDLAEWTDRKTKETIFIYWKTPAEWADKIQKWVDDNGLANTVCTFFELLEGETGEGSEFFGMDKECFKKALKVLEKRGRAEMFSSGDNEGVKFLQ